MKKVAVVTALTLATYQEFGYEIGTELTVMDSYERDGTRWFRFMGSDNLPEICQERLFEMKEITSEYLASKQLEAALRVLHDRLCPDAKKTLEVEATMGLNTENSAEEIGEHLVCLIQNDCGPELERIAASLVNPELEKTEP